MSGPAARQRSRSVPKRVTPERWVAYRTVLRTFEDDAWTDRVFAAEVDGAALDARARAFAQHLTYGTVRSAKTLDHVIAQAGKRPLAKIQPQVLAALRLGAFALLADTVIPAHAAVNESVEIVRAACGERPVPFANAVLRRVQVDGETWLARLNPEDAGELATLVSMPQWIVERMRSEFGEDGIAALRAQNAGHVLDDWSAQSVRQPAFRINTLRNSVDDAMRDASAVGVELLPTELPGVMVVDGPTAALGSMIDAGRLVAQARGSAAIPLLLDVQRGHRILDMCAAPGAKTSQLAALAGADSEIVAVELHEHRARSLSALLDRCGAAFVHVICGDARTVDVGSERFDRILLDAPCTGLGVLGSRPDARWRKTPADVDELAHLQRELLAHAATLLAPDGVLVYSTCTPLTEETTDQIVWAGQELGLSVAPIGSLVPANLHDGSIMRTWPHVNGTDGFFAARLTYTGGVH